MKRRWTLERSGAASIETAIILPVTFFLILGLYVGANGIFRYQEVSTLAREGARYGSTHGAQSRKDRGLPVGTSDDWTQDIYQNGVEPYVVNLDTSQLSCTCYWPDVINQPGKPDNWPGSKVEVTITYTWVPEMFLIGPITITSTSSMPITN
jgi:hypothetical protein